MSTAPPTPYDEFAMRFWSDIRDRDDLAIVNTAEHPQTLIEMLRSSILIEGRAILISSALAAFLDDEYVANGLDPRYRPQVPALLDEIDMAVDVGALRVVAAEHTFYPPRMSTHLEEAFRLQGRVLWDGPAMYRASLTSEPGESEPPPSTASSMAQTSLILARTYVNHAFPGLVKWPMELILEWRSAVGSSLDAFGARVSEIVADAANVELDTQLDRFIDTAVRTLDAEYEDLERRVQQDSLWRRVREDLPAIAGTATAALAVSMVPQPALLRLATIGGVTVGKLVEHSVAQLRQGIADQRHHLGWLYEIRETTSTWPNGLSDFSLPVGTEHDMRPAEPEPLSADLQSSLQQTIERMTGQRLDHDLPPPRGHFVTRLARIMEFQVAAASRLSQVSSRSAVGELPTVHDDSESGLSWTAVVEYETWAFRVATIPQLLRDLDIAVEASRIARMANEEPPTGLPVVVVVADESSSPELVTFKAAIRDSFQTVAPSQTAVVTSLTDGGRDDPIAAAVNELHEKQCNLTSCRWCETAR